MKIKFTKKASKSNKIINLFFEEEEKQTNKNGIEFLNFKIKKEKLNIRKYIKLVRSIIKKYKNENENIAFDYAQFRKLDIEGVDEFWKAKLFIENLILAEYKFDKYLTKKSKELKSVEIFGDFSSEEKKGFSEGQKVADATNWARDLSNEPGGSITPTILLKEIEKKFSKTKTVKIKSLNETQTKKLKMGLYNAVGQGSKEKSQFIIAEYLNGKKNEKPIVLIGKGITYDTGGINLKLSGLLEMHMDMMGGATVIGALKAVADLGIKKNVIVIVPAVENSISGSAYRPGDILTSMSGKTVYVNNTDAEGRLVLADAITYAKKYNPSCVIDVATLTGASLVALGMKASAVFSKDKELVDQIFELGEKTGDYNWQLPLWEEYEEDVKNDFADVDNVGKVKSYGGAITAATFLYTFAKDYDKSIKWMHIDNAPRMASIPSDELEAGSTGEPVRLLVEFIKNN